MPNSLDVAERRVPFGLLAFGGVSAMAGGVIGVAMNGAGVPLSYLQGSPFTSYLIPGILLGLVIGGTQIGAALAVLLRTRSALALSTIAAFGMLVWIFVELAVIREYSPLQAIYFALGIVELVVVSLLLGVLDHSHRTEFVTESG